MILSAELLLSDDQAITGSAISENIIDLGVAGTPYDAAAPLNQDVGKGNPVCILVQVTEDFDALTSLDITFEVGATTALGTVLVTETHLLADLVAGRQTFTQVVPNGADQRYLGVRYTVSGTNPTVGKITAGISKGNQTNVTGA
jgi:hypothetical protein